MTRNRSLAIVGVLFAIAVAVWWRAAESLAQDDPAAANAAQARKDMARFRQTIRTGEVVIEFLDKQPDASMRGQILEFVEIFGKRFVNLRRGTFRVLVPFDRITAIHEVEDERPKT
ncbi:MAG: hypothetical protein FJ271_22175 [Planctomycetes bacterium]|nr:hypothetical protein [Planctomycetota bacterium]